MGRSGSPTGRSLRAGASAGRRRVGRPSLAGDRRGGVALIVGLALPTLAMCAGAGIEVTNWAMVKVELQRTADVAALAGASEWSLAANAQNAANAAADVAEVNGIAGAGTGARTWNAATSLLQDNKASAQVVTGLRNQQGKAVMVTVSRDVPLYILRVMMPQATTTVSAAGWAEPLAPVQPCLLALKQGGAGVRAQGSVNVSLSGCSARSNAGITVGGSASVTATGFYAGGTISGSVSGGPLYQNDGTIPDPYAGSTAVANALAGLQSGAGQSFNDKPGTATSLSQGSWNGWNIQGNVTLAAGTYYVNGDIKLGASATLSGTGVTIVSSGSVTMDGSASMQLTAPLAGANLGVPGMVFIGNSKSSATFGGNANTAINGVVYYPNGDLSFGGTSSGGSNACLELIASSVTLQGNSSMAASCDQYGAKKFASDNAAVAVVQ